MKMFFNPGTDFTKCCKQLLLLFLEEKNQAKSFGIFFFFFRNNNFRFFLKLFSLLSVPRDVPGRDGTDRQNPVPARPVDRI